MMKKYIILSLLVAGTLFLPSCLFQEEDVFDKSASERMDEAITNLRNTLKSSTDGWRVTYFTDTTRYGGYNMIMKFDDSKVTIQGDNVFEAGEDVGYYTINKSQGVVLDFNTYNKVLGFLADPSRAPLGLGLAGDNEFVYQKTSAGGDTIYFHTKKTGLNVEFIRYTGVWTDYLDKVNSMSDKLVEGDMEKYYFKVLHFDDGTKLTFLDFDKTTRALNPVYSINDSIVNIQSGIAFTTTGFKFHSPIVYDGKTFQEFKYVTERSRFEIVGGNIGGYLAASAEPSFVFPGELNNFILSGKKTYRFSGIYDEANEATKGWLDILDVSSDTLNMGYALLAFMPLTRDNVYQGYYYTSIFIQTKDDKGSATLALGLYTFDAFRHTPNLDGRSDKFLFTSPAKVEFSVNNLDVKDYPQAEQIKRYLYANLDEFNTEFTRFIKYIFPTRGGIPADGVYIAVPDGLMRNFTFVSTDSNKYFGLAQF